MEVSRGRSWDVGFTDLLSVFWWFSIQIILKEDVEFLGKKGELLDVRAGYYRNFLLPTGKAQIVTPLLLK